MHEKGHIWKPATCTCENGKNLGSIIDDLVNICDEIINTANSASTNVMCQQMCQQIFIQKSEMY